MSLLLDALKKAELAKQIAKAESGAPAQAESAPADHAPRVITREKLPDITQPMVILTDDLPSSEPRAPEPPKATQRPELSLQEPQPFTPAAPAEPQFAEPLQSGGRAQADQLFQVKEMEYNPRRPFYITLGALGVVAVGYAGYVWWQMQPKYSYTSPPVATQAPPAAPAAPVTVAAVTPPAPAPAQPAVITPVQQAPLRAAPAPATGVIPPIQPVRPRARPRPATEVDPVAAPPTAPAAALAPDQAGGVPIAVNAPVLSVDPQIEQGYQAFQKGDLVAARESYQRALTRSPTSRDALLGLAAIDVRSGQLEAAEARYLKLLEIDPRDGRAVAALVALRGRLDPVASESRLKTLISNQPEVPQLHFSLGNQYAQQARWSEAQAAYFKAYSIDPQNADYAFNLAVSLDQLRQKKPALEYYQRALALAENRAASFDAGQARLRVQELSK